ncbi:unnamed protein product [Brassicogethes aeneus]|uniref:Uncharacterized protein n=1 Tax=Brassicogethes aeneus TaxID=1431903 RepID=A0A9P0BF36_BRAAE|nr:unnamed protein product [Brassicogethes aeneus]
MDKTILWTVFLVLIIQNVIAQNCKREPKCQISRVHGMKSADCFNKNFRSFPQCITSDVQVLDLSQNRIRKLDKNDLKRYQYLKLLYLNDNVIVQIHEDAFEGLNDLTSLDLSLNALNKVPPLVFQLPNLKTLYLGHNMNINIADSLESSKSISSPLANLDLSFISDGIPAVFPDFGNLPLLFQLNISGTEFENMSPSHFAGLCNLKYLHNENTTTEFFESCDCIKINKWLKDRKVEFKPFVCGSNLFECETDISEEDLQKYDQCKIVAEKYVRTIKINRGLIYAGIVAGIFVVCVALYFIYKKTNRIKPKKAKENNLLL